MGRLFTRVQIDRSNGGSRPNSKETVIAVPNNMSDYVALANEHGMKICKQLAGSVLPEMLSSQSKAESYLDHTDSNLRRAALLVIGMNWSPTPEFRAICSRMMLGDCDTAVRIEAMEAFAASCAETDAAETGQLLAHIVCNQSQPLDIRKHAHAGLFGLRARRHGPWVDGWLEATSPEFRIPDDVDWSFVRSFLK